MKHARKLCAVAASLLFASPAAAGGQRPVVIELFTSQGCSSCPPADALLGRLAQRHDVVAMSLPITYWDMLGWKDTLASAANTARQKAYAAAMGKGGVYTPQIVVDGISDVVGSRQSDVEAAIARRAAEIAASRAKIEAEHAAVMSELVARAEAHAAREIAAHEAEIARSEADVQAMKVSLVEARQDAAEARHDASEAQRGAPEEDLSIPVSITESPDAMHIEVGAKGEKSDRTATVWLFHLRNTATVNIGAGENDGRTMTYRNVVGDLRSVGFWDGAHRTFDVSRSSLSGLPHDAVVVVVQRGGYGRVVGATLLSHPAYEASN